MDHSTIKPSSSKRKVPDINDNFPVMPAPPPALRSANASMRRMTIAAGVLPATPASWAVPAVPVVPVSAASRRHAEVLEQQDSTFNNYITGLGLKLRLERAAAVIHHDITEQVSTLLDENIRWRWHFEKSNKKLVEVRSLASTSSRLVHRLPSILDESAIPENIPYESLMEGINSHMNSLKSKHVQLDTQKFGKVDEDINEISVFCVPSETLENSVSTADCLCEIGGLMKMTEENKNCLDELKDNTYGLLAQNFSSTMKL